MINNTQDLSKFGYRELKMAAELLTAYCENPNILQGDNIAIEFNPNLVDDNYDVAMMNGDTLEQWFYCHYCGYEGFLEDMKEHGPLEELDSECIEYLQNIGAIGEGDPTDMFINRVVDNDNGTMYYCEYCETAYQYRDNQQQACEHCNRMIDDDHIVHIEW